MVLLHTGDMPFFRHFLSSIVLTNVMNELSGSCLSVLFFFARNIALCNDVNFNQWATFLSMISSQYTFFYIYNILCLPELGGREQERADFSTNPSVVRDRSFKQHNLESPPTCRLTSEPQNPVSLPKLKLRCVMAIKCVCSVCAFYYFCSYTQQLHHDL